MSAPSLSGLHSAACSRGLDLHRFPSTLSLVSSRIAAATGVSTERVLQTVLVCFAAAASSSGSAIVVGPARQHARLLIASLASDEDSTVYQTIRVISGALDEAAARCGLPNMCLHDFDWHHFPTAVQMSNGVCAVFHKAPLVSSLENASRGRRDSADVALMETLAVGGPLRRMSPDGKLLQTPYTALSVCATVNPLEALPWLSSDVVPVNSLKSRLLFTWPPETPLKDVGPLTAFPEWRTVLVHAFESTLRSLGGMPPADFTLAPESYAAYASFRKAFASSVDASGYNNPVMSGTGPDALPEAVARLVPEPPPLDKDSLLSVTLAVHVAECALTQSIYTLNNQSLMMHAVPYSGTPAAYGMAAPDVTHMHSVMAYPTPGSYLSPSLAPTAAPGRETATMFHAPPPAPVQARGPFTPPLNMPPQTGSDATAPTGWQNLMYPGEPSPFSPPHYMMQMGSTPVFSMPPPMYSGHSSGGGYLPPPPSMHAPPRLPTCYFPPAIGLAAFGAAKEFMLYCDHVKAVMTQCARSVVLTRVVPLDPTVNLFAMTGGGASFVGDKNDDIERLVRMCLIQSRQHTGIITIREATQAKLGKGSDAAARRADIIRLLKLGVQLGFLQAYDGNSKYAYKIPPHEMPYEKLQGMVVHPTFRAKLCPELYVPSYNVPCKDAAGTGTPASSPLNGDKALGVLMAGHGTADSLLPMLSAAAASAGAGGYGADSGAASGFDSKEYEGDDHEDGNSERSGGLGYAADRDHDRSSPVLKRQRRPSAKLSDHDEQ